MSASCPQVGMNAHVKYCLCTACWFILARSAFEPQEFIAQAERHVLNYGQRKVIDGMKLQEWDDWAKGEAS